jgi:hypothetical protein
MFGRRLPNVHLLSARGGGRHPGCLRDLGCAVEAPAKVQTEMFVFYLFAEDTQEFEILKRSKPIRLAVMYSNESVWIVPGTISTDD